MPESPREQEDRPTNPEVFKDDKERLDKYKDDIIDDAEELADVRDKANAAMRFVSVSGGQWEGFMGDQWDERTKLEFDQTSDFVNRFLGEWNQNRMDVEYKPDDAKTSDDDAELMNGIYRADFRDESGKLTLDQAVGEQSICGYGCVKLATKFVNDEDPENDEQRVEFRPIYNAYNRVIWDRAAQRIDKRDARHCTLLDPYTPDGFRQIYGEDESAVSAYTPHNRSYNDYSVRSKTTIYVATRYTVIRKKTLFHVYGNTKTNEVESYSDADHKEIIGELKASKFHQKIRERWIIEQTVEKSVFSGERFLEKPRRISGKFIPIIPFYGYRSYVDNVERYHGLVQKMMDPQRLLNMQMSQLAENSASSGQDVPIFDPDQMPPNLANLWADRNNKPYMLAKALKDPVTGQVIQHGPLGYLKPPQLDGSTAALLQIVPQHIQLITGGAPQDTLDPDASGKAILALQKRENMKTQTIMDNAKASIEWMGEVYQSIASEIYNSQRLMRTIGIDGRQTQVLMQKEMVDKKTGRIIQGNSLKGKRFRVYSGVGPQYETLREQTVEDLKGMMELLIKAGPAGAKYIPILASMMLENISGVGLSELKDMVRKDMLLQGLRKPENEEEQKMVEAAKAQQQNDPQKDLLLAAADQAASEGAKFRSEARNLDSKSVLNVSNARKSVAETRKILSEIGINRENVLKELLSTTLRRAEKLPFPGQQQ